MANNYGIMGLLKNQATEIWQEKRTMRHFGGYVSVQGKVHSGNGFGWICRDWKTEKIDYCIKEPRNCSTTFINHRFVCIEKNGTVSKLGVLKFVQF